MDGKIIIAVLALLLIGAKVDNQALQTDNTALHTQVTRIEERVDRLETAMGAWNVEMATEYEPAGQSEQNRLRIRIRTLEKILGVNRGKQ